MRSALRLAVAVCLALPGFARAADSVKPVKAPRLIYKAVPFSQIEGWQTDDMRGALIAFRIGCGAKPKVLNDKRKLRIQAALAEVCARAGRLDLSGQDGARNAKRFFQKNFRPYRVKAPDGAPSKGLLTAYYEPEIAGSLTPTAEFSVPVLRRPADLIDLVDPVQRATVNDRLGAMRRLADGSLVPYFTRGEIEDGALGDRKLELVYLADPVVAFFMHIQGSAKINLPDGKSIRIGFDGKNGYPYTSIARVLIERGELARADSTTPRLEAWLRADPARGRKVMQENRSYIFFKANTELSDAEGPLGGQGVPLTPGRSLAIDAGVHVLGTPIFVDGGNLDVDGSKQFRRLMIAQDVGSAIKGAERGDLYIGSGQAAGKIAGGIKHDGKFIVLLPRSIKKP